MSPMMEDVSGLFMLRCSIIGDAGLSAQERPPEITDWAVSGEYRCNDRISAMLGPLQHLSVPLDPVRQQVTPPQPTLPPQAATPPGLQPLPPSDSGRDQFSRKQEE